jgi:hypothetical protein
METDDVVEPDPEDLKEWDTPAFQELPLGASEATLRTGVDGPFNYS